MSTDVMIKISKAAAQEIRRLQKTQNQTDTYLRLKVQKGGCSGLYYLFEFDPKPGADECICESEDISLVIDSQSFSYVSEINIDYAEDLMGGGFQFSNPQATSTCGCGNSFSTESLEDKHKA